MRKISTVAAIMALLLVASLFGLAWAQDTEDSLDLETLDPAASLHFDPRVEFPPSTKEFIQEGCDTIIGQAAYFMLSEASSWWCYIMPGDPQAVTGIVTDQMEALGYVTLHRIEPEGNLVVIYELEGKTVSFGFAFDYQEMFCFLTVISEPNPAVFR